MNSDSLNMVSRLGEGHMPCTFFLSEPQLKTTVPYDKQWDYPGKSYKIQQILLLCSVKLLRIMVKNKSISTFFLMKFSSFSFFFCKLKLFMNGLWIHFCINIIKKQFQVKKLKLTFLSFCIFRVFGIYGINEQNAYE